MPGNSPLQYDRTQSDVSLINALILAKVTRFHWSIPERRLLSWDDTYEEMLGVRADAEKGPGHFVGLYFHPDDGPRVLREYEIAEKEKRGLNLEYRIILPNGDLRHIHEVSEIEVDAAGQAIGYFGTLQNITERKLKDAELETSRRQLADAARRAKLVYWQQDLDSPGGSDSYSWAKSASMIFAESVEKLPSNSVAYVKLIHPADAERVATTYRAVRAKAQSYELEYRIRRPDGEYAWVHEIGEAEREKDGKPLSYAGTLQDITERKLKDAELETSRRQLAYAMRRAKLVYWEQDLEAPDGPDNYSWATTATTIFGESVGDLPSGDNDYLRLIHPADVERVAAKYRAVSAKAQPYELEYRVRRSDGNHAWVHEIGEIDQQDGEKPLVYAGTLQDITDIKSAAAALEESEQRFRMMADTVPALVWVRDEKGVYTYFNKTYLDYSGRSLEDEIRADFEADVHPDDVEKWRIEDARTATPDQAGGSLEYRLRGAEGEYRWFLEVWRARFDAEGRHLGEIGVLVDTTERKRMEEEQRQLQKLQSIGRLAGGIAHDLNNLLTPILGLTEMTVEGMPEGSRERTNLEKVLAAAERASQLVEQILTFGRRDKPNRQPVKLGPLVTEVLLLMRSALSTSIAIRSQVDPETPEVLGDVTQLHQVLMNLASNAASAMGIRGGSLTVRVAPVTLDAVFCETHQGLSPGLHAQLSVSDTGGGIDDATLKRIFEPFFTTKGIGEGTGLGLSVVHGIVTSHGGAIYVESEVGVGTTFMIYLPVSQSNTAGDSSDGIR